MKFIAILFSIQGLIWLSIAVIIIVLIIKRIKNKKNETFEKRDN